MLVNCFTIYANDILTFVVIYEIKVLQRRNNVFLLNASQFADFTIKRANRKSVQFVLGKHIMALTYLMVICGFSLSPTGF